MRSLRRLCPAFALIWSLFSLPSGAAPLEVATLHPVLTEVAQQVGGAQVKVIPVVPAGADVHHFSPTPGDVKKLLSARLILVAGKNLENYLPKLRNNLAAGQKIVEVGRTIPSEKIEPGEETFLCCPEHAKGAIDPHWWNSVENMQRAGRIIADEYAALDPANKEAYRTNAAAWSTRLDGLKKWAKKEISTIPSGSRKLATAHLSLRYFAREFGFKLVPVQGLNHNTAPTPHELEHALKTIRTQKITAVFPEQGVNAKYLRQIATEAGIKVASELIADGNGTGALASYEASVKHNVQAIVAALKL